MEWQQLTLFCRATDAEAWEERLFSEGAVAVTLRDAADEPLYEPPLGTTPLWANTLVTALFEEGVAVEAVLRRLALHGTLPSYQLQNLPDQVWERSWMEGFVPMQFGQRLWIVPSWHQPPDPSGVIIDLDPGIAFGTGTHATTRLCLEWIDGHAAAIAQSERVVDFGCGSGILALAAAKMGAQQLYAVDNDPQALDATRRNALQNHLDLTCVQIELPKPFWQRGLEGQVGVVLANILANPLIELAPKLISLLQPRGVLVLSGILTEQAEAVMAAYTPQMIFVPPVVLEGWVRLEGRLRG